VAAQALSVAACWRDRLIYSAVSVKKILMIQAISNPDAAGQVKHLLDEYANAEFAGTSVPCCRL
jgi:hypothetical protein